VIEVRNAQPIANLYHAKTLVSISPDTGVCSIGVPRATKPDQAALRPTNNNDGETHGQYSSFRFTSILQNDNTALTFGMNNEGESVENGYGSLNQGGIQCFG